jgi:hypothetical protein
VTPRRGPGSPMTGPAPGPHITPRARPPGHQSHRLLLPDMVSLPLLLGVLHIALGLELQR